MLKLKLTVDEDHLGAVFEDQVGDSTVGQRDAHQVLTLQSQNLHRPEEPGSLTWSHNSKAKAAKGASNTGVTEEGGRLCHRCRVHSGRLERWSKRSV